MNADLKRPKELNGGEALLTMVIKEAVCDALLIDQGDERADAWRYLASPQFDEHLELLGLQPGMVPQDIEEVANEAA